ncbi:MAG: hypothetical protein U0930_12235 [Pirellulales bacterium]
MKTTPSTPITLPSSRYWAAAIAVWCCSAIAVWAWMTVYAGSADPIKKDVCSTWPSDSLIHPASGKPTLVLFLHPRCPCSVATIHELERVLTGSGIQSGQLPKVVVVASLPTDHSSQNPTNPKLAEWTNTNTIEAASKLRNAEIYWDIGGIEAERFKAKTSGSVLLYNAKGLQRFSGGVTIARGHEGASVGGDYLRELLQDPSSTSIRSTPVFGCALVKSSSSLRPTSASPIVNELVAGLANEGNEE